MSMSKEMREEVFIQELIKGKSQRQAYLVAYPHRIKWKETTIDSKASKLFNKDTVKARYTQLSKKLVEESEDETIMKAKEILQIYTRIARGEEEEEVISGFGKKTKKASLKDRLKALERLDKILALEKNLEEGEKIRDDWLMDQLDKMVDSVWDNEEGEDASEES
jgi:phage terminase small subunit